MTFTDNEHVTVHFNARIPRLTMKFRLLHISNLKIRETLLVNASFLVEYL